MNEYYAPVGFHFIVNFTNIGEGNTEQQFQSVSGLSVEMETEEIAEGGENRYKHTIPVRTKFSNLVLKRGMFKNSQLIDWCRRSLDSLVIEPTDITISLLGEDHIALQTWRIAHAYPVKWSVGDFNAEENKLVIETIELTYNYFTIE